MKKQNSPKILILKAPTKISIQDATINIYV